MGKGDKRTRRGKIYNGSHGKRRPGKPKKAENAGHGGTAPARPGRGR
jgi:30S ribosomal protein S31